MTTPARTRRWWQALALVMARDRLLQNPGRIVISSPFVWVTLYGAAGPVRAEFVYTLLSTPGYVWTDRSGRLRASVQIRNENQVWMGGPSAPYAVWVERNPKFAPMRRAFRESSIAIDAEGNVR